MKIIILKIDPINDAPMALSKKEARNRPIPLMGYGDLEKEGFKVSKLAGKFFSLHIIYF